MSERRIRASAPQPSRPRVKNDYNSRGVTFRNNDDDSEIPTTTANNMKHAGVYIPPTINKAGITTSNRVFEAEPSSTGTPTSTSVKYWPQPLSNHLPAADHHLIETNDSKERNQKAIAAAKKKILQLKKQNGILHGRHSSYDRPVNRRPRGRGLHYSESSEDERYNPDYREMDVERQQHKHRDDFAASASASFLQSQSTVGSQSDDDGGMRSPSTVDESIDPRNHKSRGRNDERFGYITKSISENGTFETQPDGIHNVQSDAEDSFFKVNQVPPFCTITITAVQILITVLQFTMCGVASLDVNPTVGPFPDAFSQWGGKNPYLMLNDNEWWRLVSPALLHVGVLHLLVNIYCQTNAGMMFEREWGWATWLFVYIASELGCSSFSNLFDPNSIAVGSTGAIMGLFAAKLSQVVLFSLFETKHDDDAIRVDQLSTILCGLTLASLMGALTYIDFSGNLGGLVSGFFAGIVVFSSSLRWCCTSFFWSLIGLAGLISSIAVPLYFFILEVEPDEQLADVCQYFRSFFPEGYECGCLWN